MNVVHFITRLIIGGAQENTLLTVEDQHRDYDDRVTLICGPGLGPEGSLTERAQAGGLDMRIIPQLQRNIHPWRDWSSYRRLLRMLRDLITAHLPGDSNSQDGLTVDVTSHDENVTMEEMERKLIEQTLEATDGNRKEAATRLGIGERTLYRKLKKYNLT